MSITKVQFFSAILFAGVGAAVFSNLYLQRTKHKNDNVESKYDLCVRDIEECQEKRFEELPSFLKSLVGDYSVLKVYEKALAKPVEEIQLLQKTGPSDNPPPPIPVGDVKEPLLNVATLSFRDQSYSDCRADGCSYIPSKPEPYLSIMYSQPRMEFKFPINKLEQSGDVLHGEEIAKFETFKRR